MTTEFAHLAHQMPTYPRQVGNLPSDRCPPPLFISGGQWWWANFFAWRESINFCPPKVKKGE
jgi:hypothetical protein